MICDLSQNNLREHLEKYVGALIDYSIKNDPTFDYSKILQTVYNDVKGLRNDHVQALGIAYHVPMVIDEFINTNKELKKQKTELVNKGYNPNSLLQVIGNLKEAYEKGDPLTAIAGVLGVSVMDVDTHLEIIGNTPSDQSTVKGPTVTLGIEGLRQVTTDKLLMSLGYNSTTGESAKETGAVKSLTEIDAEKAFYDNIQRNLLSAKRDDSPDFTEVEYGGHKGFKSRIIFERYLEESARRPNRQDKFKFNILVLVITDNDGNILYFNEDGTVDKSKTTGKPVYSVLKSTKKKEEIISSVRGKLESDLKNGIITQDEFDAEFKMRKAEIEADAQTLDGYKEQLKSKQDQPIIVNIIGGFKGAITNPDNLTANEQELAAKTLDQFELTQEEKDSITFAANTLKDYTYNIPAIKFNNYDQLVTLKNRKVIGEQDPDLLQNIVDILLDDVEIDGKKLTDAEKVDYITQFINPSTSKRESAEDQGTTLKDLKQYTISLDTRGTQKKLFISLNGTPLDLNNKAVSKERLKEFLGKNAYIHFHEKSYKDSSIVFYNPTTGKKETRNYYNFISSKITPRIIMDVKTKRPMVLNSHLTFELSRPIKEVKEEVKKTTEEVKQNNIPTNNEEQEENFDDLKRSNLLESLASAAQKTEAERWWAESTLSKAVDENGKPLFNLNQLSNVVNSDAWAEFSRGVITLYKGSDYTHVYHEAWHAFSQTYLTYNQRTELYNALGKLKGSFVGIKKINGPDGAKYVKENISFSSASRRELEEFIAEEFRSYAMNKGKFITKSNSNNVLVKLFNRIWQALKALVGADVDVYTNPDSQGLLSEMFNKLYTAKDKNSLLPYKASVDNAEFGNLNAGVVDEKNQQVLSVSESLLFTRIIDGIVSDTITSYVKKGAYSGATALFKNAARQETIFKDVLAKLNQRRQELLKELNATTDPQKKVILENKITLLTKAVKDDVYGNIREVISGKSKKSSILSFYRSNSTFKDMYTALTFDVESDDAVDEADETGVSKGDGRFDTPINGLASEKLANNLVLTIIKSLTKQKKNGLPELNELGFAEPIEFKPFWRVLMDKASGETSVLGLYTKLKEAGQNVSPLFQQLLDKLYSPKIVKDDKGNNITLSPEDTFATMFTEGTGIGDLWMKLVQSLNLHRIDLAPVKIEQNDGKFEIRSGVTTTENKKVLKDWKDDFQQLPQSPFIDKVKQVNRLNIDNIIAKYVEIGKTTGNKNTYTVAKENYINFLHSIGIYISKNYEIESKLVPSDINYIANAIGKVYEYNQSLPKGSDKIQVIENPVEFFSSSRELPNKEKIKSVGGDINYLADLEAEYSEEYSSQMRPTPDGNTKSVSARNNSDTQKINAIRKAKRLSDLFSSDPELVHMNYLDPASNPLSKGLVILKSLFSTAVDSYGEKIKDNQIHIRDLAGVQFKGEDGASIGIGHSKMSKTDKFLTNLFSTLYSGHMETVLPGDKSSFFALKLDKIITYKNKKTNYLYIDTSAFLTNEEGQYITGYNGMEKMLEIMYPKLEGEIKRIAMFKADAKLPEDQQTYNKYEGLSRGTEFDIFDDILNTKDKKLKDLLKSDEFIERLNKADGDLLTVLNQDKSLKAELNKQIATFFEKLNQQYIKDLFMPAFNADPSNLDTLQYINDKSFAAVKDIVTKDLTEKDINNISKDDKIQQSKILQAAMMSYTINNFIHKTETTVLFQGDGIQFDHSKDESTKRTSGSQSGGTVFAVDKLTKLFVDSKVGRLIEQKLLDKGEIKRKEGLAEAVRTYGPTLNSAIIKESEVGSEYFNMYKDLFMKDFINKGFEGEDLQIALYGKDDKTGKIGTGERKEDGTYDTYDGGKMNAFAKIKDGDGQGWITLDTYRILKRVEGNWSDEQEKAYMKIVNDEVITPDEVTELFPVYKLQYNGALATERGKYPAQAFHKFSLMPLIPSVIKGFPAEKLNKAMMAQNIDYTLFKSGSKRSFIKSSAKSKGDEIYTGDTSNIKDVNEIEFTPNPIYISYLKNQTEVNAFYKEKSTFSTQLRVLLTSGLYENKVPVDFLRKYKNREDGIKAWDKLSKKEKEEKSEYHRLSNEFIANLKELVEYKKQELLDDLGWTIDPKTKEPVGDIQSMITFLVKELKRQGFSDHEISIIKSTDPDTDKESEDTFKPTDISVSPLAPRFEKLLMAVVNNRLIKLKMKGEALVEGSSAFFQSYTKPTKFRKPTEEEVAKYDNFGTNGLKSYVVDVEGKKETLGFTFKRAFTDSDMGLLQTAYFTKDEQGKYVSKEPIAVYDKEGKLDFAKSFARLNEMLLLDEWLNTDENKKKIRLTGVRIPTQGLNSMEFGQVAEFLLPDAGPVIIIPAEIVAKSGTDFDVDKMTTYMPHVSKNGTLFKKTTKSELDKKIALLEEKFKKLAETKAEINELKAKKSDKWLNIQSHLSDFRKEVIRASKSMFISENTLKDLTNKKNRELIETLSDPKNEEFLKAWFPKAYSIYTSRIKGATVEDIKSVETVLQNLTKEKTELSSVYKEMSDAQELSRNIGAGIENALIDSVVNILGLPENAVALMSPNDTSLVKPIADKLKGHIQKADDEIDFTKSLMTGEKAAEKGISPTSIYTETYNIKKQQENSSGKGSLGIAANENRMNNLLNMAGGLMKNSMLVEVDVEEKGKARKELVTVPIDIYLKTNKIDGRLSMSHLLDSDDINSIADIISQLMNGFLDVGKDAWVAYIQGNPEVAPKILWMLEVGVPIEHIAYFVSNPLTRAYVNDFKKRRSTLANILYGPGHNRMGAKQDSIDFILGSLSFSLGEEYNLKDNKKSIYGVYKALQGIAKPEYFDKGVMENIARSKANPADPAQVAGFLQYIYIERLIEEYEEMKKEFKPDTNTSTDLYTASARIAGLSKAKNSKTFDADVTNYIEKDSIISPFFLQEFARKLFSRLFKLRDDDRVNKFLINRMTDKGAFFKSKAQTGYDAETYVVKFKNFISQYIFAQNLRQYRYKVEDGKKGYPTTYKGKKIDLNVLQQANIDFDNKLYDINNDTPQAYSSKNRNLASVNTAAFADATREEFIEFVLEREHLRSTYSLNYLVDTKEFELRKARLLKTGYSKYNKSVDESNEKYNNRLNDLTYEDWLANTALKNIYNSWQLFKSGDNTIARELMDIINNYPEISDNTNYSILKQFIDQGVDDRRYRNIVNFQLKNYSNLDEGLIDEYHRQWKNLSSNQPKLIGNDEKTRKANTYISRFFENLPLVAFLQSGMESGQFSLSSVMPYTNYKEIMEQASGDFLSKLESNPTSLLEELRILFENQHSIQNSKLRKRAINLRKDIKLLPSEDFNIENQPFITKKQDGVYIINKTYYGNGMTNTVGMDTVNRLSKNDSETVYLLSPADVVKFSQVYLTGEDMKKAKEDVKILIDSILDSGYNVAIYPEGFMANPNPLPAKSESTKQEAGSKMDVGSFVKYNGEEYIITKKINDKEWQIYRPLKEGTESKLKVAERNLTLTGAAATRVTYRGTEYLVTEKNNIISLATNTIMKWQESDGNRRDILALAKTSKDDNVQAPVSKPTPTQPQTSVSTEKFAKKNIFTVTPQKGVSDNKAAIKASIATQYIGFGEDIVGKDGKRSTTQIYREQAGKYANTGNYSASDVIFVSIPGLRGDATIAKREQDKTINEAIKAVEAGATILTDNKAYTDASSYNTGEKRLYKNMEAKGYNYSEITVDGQVIGTWSKTQPQAQALDFKTMPEFTIERKREILSNFAKAFKMTPDEAYEYINNALNTKGKEVVLKELNRKDQYGNNCY